MAENGPSKKVHEEVYDYRETGVAIPLSHYLRGPNWGLFLYQRVPH